MHGHNTIHRAHTVLPGVHIQKAAPHEDHDGIYRLNHGRVGATHFLTCFEPAGRVYEGHFHEGEDLYKPEWFFLISGQIKITHHNPLDIANNKKTEIIVEALTEVRINESVYHRIVFVTSSTYLSVCVVRPGFGVTGTYPVEI